ncbi:uncharacterized protein LOC112128022 [Cimex lectularius]|uniref:Endonuclease/exonuclease/phosphatase domain-containing protein n=1 Tax=Cimex lectularius TaxID=79782 RepID=A0A8I6SNK1_CIMLE|nr:uncharacterized protein LOC112128022 [Cimex lectularius]
MTTSGGVEEFISSHNLHVVNREGCLTTFANSQRETNIDVTLAGREVSNWLVNWDVLDTDITSDHRFIVFELRGNTSNPGVKAQKGRVRQDWEIFRTCLENTRSDFPRENLDDEVARLESRFKQAITKSEVKPKSRKNRKQKWWTKELEAKKKLVHRLSLAYSRRL